MDYYQFSMVLRNVSTLARERNEMLKDSQYANFAFSNDALQKDIIKTAGRIFQEQSSRQYQEMYNRAFRTNIRVR